MIKTRKQVENEMFLDDEYWDNHDLDKAIEFSDMLDGGPTPSWVRKRSNDEALRCAELEYLKRLIIQVQQMEVKKVGRC